MSTQCIVSTLETDWVKGEGHGTVYSRLGFGKLRKNNAKHGQDLDGEAASRMLRDDFILGHVD